MHATLKRSVASRAAHKRARAPLVHPASAAARALNTTTPGTTVSGSIPFAATPSSKTDPKHFPALTWRKGWEDKEMEEARREARGEEGDKAGERGNRPERCRRTGIGGSSRPKEGDARMGREGYGAESAPASPLRKCSLAAAARKPIAPPSERPGAAAHHNGEASMHRAAL